MNNNDPSDAAVNAVLKKKDIAALEALEDASQAALDYALEKSEFSSNAIIHKFIKKKLGVASVIVILILSVIAIFAPLIAPYNPMQMSSTLHIAPSADHLLGTDYFGRDVLSRLIYGARVSLIVGISVSILSISLGTILGLLAGYCGGMVDALIMRSVDIIMTFPPIILLLAVVGVMGQGLWKIIFVLGFLGWPQVARLVRGSVLSVREMDYVKAATMMGFKTTRIIFGHILPNVTAPILVNATFKVANAIVTEASLSFLGMGVQPPTPTWGNMLTNAKSISILSKMPWEWLPPGIMIVILVLAVNFVGDSLRDILALDDA